MRIAAVVGDLGSPFYEEERQRDVWNEASAVGFQFVLWLGLIAANVMVWVGGAPAVPYAATTFGIVALASIVLLTYAQRLGVDAGGAEYVRTPAALAAAGLIMAFGLGVAFAWEWPADGLWGGFADGLVVGALLGGASAAIAVVWKALRRRRSRGAER